ncbi:MAG TPA: hypothetical protein VE035_17075 [Puia sp.]|nr:hypothetical protein [Puia sp.]
MKHISYWARRHPLQARLAIVLLHLILIPLAFYIGSSLRQLHITIAPPVILLALSLFLVTATFYPRKGSRQYWRQKTCDMILCACSFVMISSLGNTDSLSPLTAEHSYGCDAIPSGKPTAEEILASNPEKGNTHLSRQEKKILKKEFRKQFLAYTKALATGDGHGAERALLILLAVVVAVGLIALLAGLACSISCSGSPGLAFVLFFLGTAGIVVLTVISIKAISHIGRRKPADPASPSPAVPNIVGPVFMPIGPAM